MDLVYRAMDAARYLHREQKRKYTGAPYFVHLAEVAGIVATVDSSPLAMAVAWLHDSIEDQGQSYATLSDAFGWAVAEGVQWLSDMETGNRAERKAASRERLAWAPDWVQTIKCADLISNTSSIVQHDPTFAVTYLEEKRLLLDVLTKADRKLWTIAREQSEAPGC